MSITFCIEAHNATEDDALASENAPTLNVHNTGGWTLLTVLGIEPDHYGTIDAYDLLDRIDAGPVGPIPDHPGRDYVVTHLPRLHSVAITAQRLGRQVVWGMNADDVMDRVVTRLVDAIEAGADNWQMPWRSLGSTGWPTNAATGNRYSGGNVLALSLAAVDHGHPTARWATYKQWHARGAQVRKGERGTLGIFWKVTDPTTDDQRDDNDDDGSPNDQQRRRSAWARTFTVFNAAQVDHDPHPAKPVTLPTLARDARAEAFFAAVPAVVRWGSGSPCHRPHGDDVVMPAFDTFHTATDAYATLAHELVHWTGHRSRLARTYGRRFGDDAYAAEELVAELGAAFTCALVGIDTVARTDHAAYLAHWCRLLRAQPSILWTVAAKAQTAADWLATYSTTPADTDDIAVGLSPVVNVTVTYPGGQPQTVGTAVAVAVVAAALRAGHPVTVSRPDTPTRWALTARARTVTAAAVNPDLFIVDPATPAWVERLAAAAADLL